MPVQTMSVRAYVLAALALLALTGLTIGVAFLPLGPWHTTVALGIAAAKASIIALVFMHLRHAPSTLRLTAVVGLIWLAIMLGGTLDDVLTRGWLPIPGK